FLFFFSSSRRHTRFSRDWSSDVCSSDFNLISSTSSDLEDDEGWAFLGEVGALLQKKQPNFDSRNYGFQKLTPLIKSIDIFEIEHRKNSVGTRNLIYVRVKNQ